MSALAGLKLLGVSAGLLLARGVSRSRGTRRGRRSPQEVKIETKIGRTSNPWNRMILHFGVLVSADGIIGEKLAVYDSVN